MLEPQPGTGMDFDATNGTLSDEFTNLNMETDGRVLQGIMEYCLAHPNTPVPEAMTSQSGSIDKLVELNFLTRVEGGVVLSDAWLAEMGQKN